MKFSPKNLKKVLRARSATFFSNRRARLHDRLEPKECLICGSSSLTYAFAHTEWPRRVFRCSACGHAAVYNTERTPIPAEVFIGSHDRADFYINHLRRLNPSSVLEIGTPDDFYFLNRIGELFPNAKRYGYQPYRSTQTLKTPKDITMLNSLENFSVDLLYAEHVIKHVADPHAFVNMIRKQCRFFIVETLDSPPWRMEELAHNVGRYKTKWHYHWFTKKSFKTLFKDTPCSLGYISYPLKNKERSSLIAYSLGEYRINEVKEINIKINSLSS